MTNEKELAKDMVVTVSLGCCDRDTAEFNSVRKAKCRPVLGC